MMGARPANTPPVAPASRDAAPLTAAVRPRCAGCARARTSLTAAHVRPRFDHLRAVELARAWGCGWELSLSESAEAHRPRPACSLGESATSAHAACHGAYRPHRPPFAGLAAAPVRAARRAGHRPHRPPFAGLAAARVRAARRAGHHLHRPPFAGLAVAPSRAARPSGSPAPAPTKAARA
jgi:hypothetical protein